jgi:hypothetical protein
MSKTMTKKRSRSGSRTTNAVNKNGVKTRKVRIENETSFEKRQKKVLKAKRNHEKEQERILEEIRLRKLAERAKRPKVKKRIEAFYPGMEGLVEEALAAAESRRAENALAAKAAAETALAEKNAKKLLPYAGEYPANALWGNIQWNENVKAGRDPLTGMTAEELKAYQNERAARYATVNVKPVKTVKVTVERNAPKPTSVTALAAVEDTYDTLWIANLPEEINEKAIEKKIASVIEGYDFKQKGLYDMRFIVEKGIKLPRVSAKKDEKSVGYAFVKFVDHDVAAKVFDAFKPEEGSDIGKMAFFHKVYQPDGKFIKVEKVALVEPSLTGQSS